MKRFTMYITLVFAISALLVIGGCTKNSPVSPDDENLDAIDLDFGGYTTADESPDAELVADYDIEDETVNDGVNEDPSVIAMMDSTGLDVYHVRITWGNLEWDSTASIATDWSGSAVTSKGILTTLKVIRFERQTDHLVLPRSDRKSLEWVSFTQQHFDGIHFVIINNDTTDEEGTFTINAGAYSRTFTFSELDSLDLIEDVDNLGNQIAVNSRIREGVFSPGGWGFLEGRWIRVKENGGKFWGRWVNNLGLRGGFLKGIWGINQDGNKVFHGKLVDKDHKFAGLISGVWEYTDPESGIGVFRGRWVNASLTKVGTVDGKFNTGEQGDRKGLFRGRWERRN